MAAPAKLSPQACVEDSSRAVPPGSAEEWQTASRTLVDLAHLAEECPLTWLVPFTIIEGGIHVVYGKEESFKTTLVMQLLEVLNVGGQFLDWELPGGLRVGFAELEMTERIFRERARRFLKPAKGNPNIAVLSTAQRQRILDGQTADARVRILLEWVQEQNLHVLAVDSAAKLFPPGANPNSQPEVSDVFNQLQKLGCTVILIAHPRKGDPDAGPQGNDEIAGSGRFAQDPDIVLEVRRPDRRAPRAIISWGKNRMDSKPDDLEMFFDGVDFRLYPRHPFLHLLPASREGLIREAERRYGWKQRRTDEALAELKEMQDCEGRHLVEEVFVDRRAMFHLAPSVPLEDSAKVEEACLAEPAPNASPEDSAKVVECGESCDVCTNSQGLRGEGHV